MVIVNCNYTGSWATYVSSINSLVDNLAKPTVDATNVIQAVSNGDLSGNYGNLEMREKVTHIETIVTEINRVINEIGTQGILGGAKNSL